MIRVVIADDHPAIRRLIGQLLSQSENIRVVATAASGHEALDCVRRFEPDVMTLDMVLGDMNGLEVLQRLKKVKKRPKVIVISLYTTPELINRALESGAGAYIPKKELTRVRLIEEIESLLSARA